MQIPDSFINHLSQQRIIILGAAREGLSAYHFIRQILPNLELTLVDALSLAKFPPEKLQKLEQDSNLNLVFGDEYLQNLENFTLMIKSPGINELLPEIHSAVKNGVKLSSNTQLFFDLLEGQAEVKIQEETSPAFRYLTIGVTGTKGKSTTSSLLYHVTQAAGFHSLLVGNIGKPALDIIPQIKDQTLIVLELSCHQLANLSVSPDIAVIQNITSEHLDYYPNTAAYVEAKSAISKYQQVDDVVIYNPNFPQTKKLAQLSAGLQLKYQLNGETDETSAPPPQLAQKDSLIYIKDNYLILNNNKFDSLQLPAKWPFAKTELNEDLKLVAIDELPLLGKHNLQNIAPSLIVANLLGISPSTLKAALLSFKPLPHRLELVAKINGVSFVNDSLATMPDATIAAIKAFSQPVILIAGGHERHQDFSELIKVVLEQPVKSLILLGETGARLAKELQEKTEESPHIPTYQVVDSMPQAVELAKKLAQAGEVVLMSPASASFGMFKNYADRGEQFKEEVLKK